MEKIVLIDFAGTLIKKEIIEEANIFRSKVLERSLPSSKEHSKPLRLYKANRKFIENLTGLKGKVQYRKNDLTRMVLTAEEVQNQIATNLFQIGMYMVAKKFKKKIFAEGLIKELKRIKKKGYKLAIASGVREDIISGMFQIVGLNLNFDYIFGQPPILGVSNEKNMKALKGNVVYCIGDKLSDLQAGKKVGAKTIFVTWGHPSGGERKYADYVINGSKELKKIIR